LSLLGVFLLVDARLILSMDNLTLSSRAPSGGVPKLESKRAIEGCGEATTLTRLWGRLLRYAVVRFGRYAALHLHGYAGMRMGPYTIGDIYRYRACGIVVHGI